MCILSAIILVSRVVATAKFGTERGLVIAETRDGL